MTAPNWTLSMDGSEVYDLDLGLLELVVIEDRGAPWRWRVLCGGKAYLAAGKESSCELAQAAAVQWAREMFQLGLLRLGPAAPGREDVARLAYGVWAEGAYKDASPYCAGLQLPTWDELYESGRARWVAVVDAVIAAAKEVPHEG
jgi:hypothetical protein